MLSGFAKATCTNSRAAKLYWRPLNLKRSLPVFEWTSENEYFFEYLAVHACRVTIVMAV